jgi:hypothetical protein
LYNKVKILLANYNSYKTEKELNLSIEKETKKAKNLAQKYSKEKRFENIQGII